MNNQKLIMENWRKYCDKQVMNRVYLLKEGKVHCKKGENYSSAPLIDDLMSLDERKNQLVMAEKGKILNMYSRSHYDNLRRTVATKFFNE